MSEPAKPTTANGGDALAGRLTLGGFAIEPATRRLFGADGAEIRVQQKPFQVLLHLVQNRHRLVTRAELLARYWGDRGVYDQALTRCMSSIRKALDDQADPPRYIETRWAEGYRYIGPCVESTPTASAGALAAAPSAPPRRRRMALVAAGLALVALAAVGVARFMAAPPPIAPLERIAVLKLKPRGTVEPWLVDGLSEHMITCLSRIEGLTVITHLGDGAPAATGGGAQAVLSGTVTHDAGMLRLDARLTAAQDGAVLWSFQTERPYAEFMRAERDMVVGLATRLSARLHAMPAHSRDPEANARYFEGRHQWNQRTEASLNRAIDNYRAALAADPDFAEAYAALAQAWLLFPFYAGEPPAEFRWRARAAAEAALRLDAKSARAHQALGVIAMYAWDWAGADARFREALALDPNDATTLHWRGEMLCYRRRFEECRADLSLARELDPLSPMIAVMEGVVARWTGDYARSLAATRAVLARWPGFAFAEYELGQLASARGDWPEAVRRYRAVLPTLGTAVVGGQLAFALARAGARDEARALRDELVALGETRYLPAATLAVAELGLGNRAGALDWLERSVDGRDELAVFIGVDPHYNELRDEPRFRALLAATGLAE